MPHLSPMSWTVMMPMMWMIILYLMTATYSMKAPNFYSSPVTKSLQSSNQWSWTLQGDRD